MPVRHIRKAWFVDFRFGGERCRRKAPYNSKAGAIAYELFLRKEAGIFGSINAVLRAHTPKHRIPCPTLNEFAPRWFAGYVVVNNRIMEQRHKQIIFERHILPAFGNLRLCDIGLEEIEVYKGKKRGEGLAPKTINNQLAVLHRCLTCAKDLGILYADVPRVPLLRSPLPTFHFLTNDDCAKLIATAPQGIPRTMILMGLRTGMRFCELSALRWQNVDLVRNLVTVCQSAAAGIVYAPKNSRIRHIPLTTDIAASLAALPCISPFAFHLDGQMMGYFDAWSMLDRLSREAGIEHVSWHDLRHTFASQLVERGVSLLAVQKLLGHSDIGVTMRYSHLGKDSLREAVAVLQDPAR